MYGRPTLMDLTDTNEAGWEYGLDLHTSKEHPAASSLKQGNDPSGSTHSWEFD